MGLNVIEHRVVCPFHGLVSPPWTVHSQKVSKVLGNRRIFFSKKPSYPVALSKSFCLSAALFCFCSEAFRRLRQLDILNRVKPQVAAMCAPVERPASKGVFLSLLNFFLFHRANKEQMRFPSMLFI